jgi:hypothetical protein
MSVSQIIPMVPVMKEPMQQSPTRGRLDPADPSGIHPDGSAMKTPPPAMFAKIEVVEPPAVLRKRFLKA